jgi:amino acid adenylation domain-containing protein
MREPLHSLLDTAAERHAGRPAVRDRDGAWTYAELAEASRGFACWLRRRGLRRGDRVLAGVRGSRNFVALMYGASRAGVIVVPVGRALKPFQLNGILRDAEPSLVLVDAGRAALGATPVMEIEQAAVEAREAADARPPEGPLPCDPALLIYTSGTTSAPKGVVCPHAQIISATRMISARLDYRVDDVVLCRLPLSFDYGLYQIFLCAHAGAELVVADDLPDVALLRRIRETSATIVPVVPSLASLLIALASRDRRPTGVRLFTNTGAALTEPTLTTLRKSFPGAAVTLMYGITECKRVTIMAPDEDLLRPGAVGLPLDGTEVLILDDGDRPLPVRQTGQIVVRGPHVMTGYWRSPELTAGRFRRSDLTGETRLYTGDYGYLDEDGYLYFHGRRDDIFKRNGFRVSTLEIEAAALDIPGVRQAVALAPGAGRDLTVAVVGEVSEAYVLRALRERLESAKVPRYCEVVDVLPMTANGKPDRAELSRRIHEMHARKR